MAAIANAVAAPGQWTPSLFKSGKPGSESMLQHFRLDGTETEREPSPPRIRSERGHQRRDCNVFRRSGRRLAQGKRVNPKRLAAALISIKPEAPAVGLMKAGALGNATIP
jgi:hypothetical protein